MNHPGWMSVSTTSRDSQRSPSETPPRYRGLVYLRCLHPMTEYFGAIIEAAAETVEQHGHCLMLDPGASRHRSTLQTLSEHPEIVGAILVRPAESAEALARLRCDAVPFVVVDPRTPPSPGVTTVSSTHFDGARSLTAHLTDLGHRRIGVLSLPQHPLATALRLAGHNAALAEAGVLPEPALVRSTVPTIAAGIGAANQLLELQEPPTALIGHDDSLAVGALHAATRRGLHVPRDLSVAGFHDSNLSRIACPPLTAVRQPLAEMGRTAVTLLMQLLDSHEPATLHLDSATQLVIRASTGPLPGLLHRRAEHPVETQTSVMR
jgi:LacI family transcriptional regulator